MVMTMKRISEDLKVAAENEVMDNDAIEEINNLNNQTDEDEEPEDTAYIESVITTGSTLMISSHLTPSFPASINWDSQLIRSNHTDRSLKLKLELQFSYSPDKSSVSAISITTPTTVSISSYGRGSAFTLLRVSHWRKAMGTFLDLIGRVFPSDLISALTTAGQVQVCEIAANERLSKQMSIFSTPPSSIIWGDSALIFRFSMEIAGTLGVAASLMGNCFVETDRLSLPLMHRTYTFSGTTCWPPEVIQSRRPPEVYHMIQSRRPPEVCHVIQSRRPPEVCRVIQSRHPSEMHRVIQSRHPPDPYLLNPSEVGAHQVTPIRYPYLLSEVCHVIPCQYLLSPSEAGACHVIPQCCPQYTLGEVEYVFLTPPSTPTSLLHDHTYILLLHTSSRPYSQDIHGQQPHPLQEECGNADNSIHVFSSFSPADHVDAMCSIPAFSHITALPCQRNVIGNQSFVMVVGVNTLTNSEEMVVGTQCQDRVGVDMGEGAPNSLQILVTPSCHLEGIGDRLGVEQRRVNRQETSADTAEVCIEKAMKVSADGNEPFSVSFLKPRNREEGVVPLGDSGSSSHCLPNPPPDTTLVKPPAVNESSAEIGVAAILENGLVVNGCVVEPAVPEHDIEVLPPHQLVETTDEEEDQNSQCCFDNPNLLCRPFQAQGGEPPPT